MDEGPPIAYQLLERGVSVISSEGTQVGTVTSVLADEAEDVFHGLLIATEEGVRFVAAETIDSIHARGVDLRLDDSGARALPPPEHAAPVYDEDPTRQKPWEHWWHVITGRNDWNRRSGG